MKKEIILKISVDCDKDEFGNWVNLKGFVDKKPIQNMVELIGYLEVIKQQELAKLFKKEVKD
mgnify:CR=1 FL=1